MRVYICVEYICTHLRTRPDVTYGPEGGKVPRRMRLDFVDD
jgi:hypothetical protein